MTQPPQFSPGKEAVVAGAIALAALGGAGWLGRMIGWPATFDPGDVDFVNPVSIMILGLVGAAGWFGVKAVRFALRQRAHGGAVLEIDPPGHLRTGDAFSGRLRVEKPVAATGPFRIDLTCYDTHEFQEEGRWKTVDFPVWTETRSLPPETDATKGLPFRFTLPLSVGPDPVPSGILPGVRDPHRTTVHVPGMRRVVAGNIPPVARQWKLVVTAPVAGPDFRAELTVPTGAPPGRGRLP